MRKLPKVIAIISLILSLQASLVSADSGAAQANRYYPVKAQNVEIVKKATIKGAPAKQMMVVPIKLTNPLLYGKGLKRKALILSGTVS